METMEIKNHINQVKRDFYQLVDSWHVDNPENTYRPDNWLVYGPYSRSVCYKKRKLLRGDYKVLKFSDVVDKYYLVEVGSISGYLTYDFLRNYRSVYYRLKKELKKNETV